MGSMKKYQWLIAISIILTKLPVSWHLLSHGIMMPGIQTVYCVNTTLEHEANLTHTLIKALHQEACSPSCSKIVVGRQIFDRSIVGDYELYCDRNVLRMVSQVLVMTGSLIGASLFGYISDRHGRKLPLIIGILMQPFMGLWVAFSPNFTNFVVAKFFLCVYVGGTMTIGFVLLSELVGKKWRPIMGVLYQLPGSLGHMSLPGIAYIFSSDWRFMQLAISLPSIVFIYFIWVIPESPRWLLAVGRTQEAIKILVGVAKYNGLPTENISAKVLVEVANKNGNGIKRGSFFDMFKSGYMAFITVAIWINWLAAVCGFYGMTQFITSFTDSFYWNIILAATVQIPGLFLCVWILNCWGRRRTQFFGNIIGLIGCLGVVFTPVEYKIYPASLGIFGLVVSFRTAYIFSGELFPTVIRTLGIGTASSIGRIGGMLGPAIEYLKEYSLCIPAMIFAALLAFSAFITLFLPETKGRDLPNTVEDVDTWRISQLKVRDEEK